MIDRLAAIAEGIERLESEEERRLITDYRWLRPWKDDFLGQVLQEQYTVELSGGGSSVVLQNNRHGGVVRLTSDSAVGSWAYLWLGNNAGFATIDPDDGYEQICRAQLSHTTETFFSIASIQPGAANYVEVCCNTDWGNNWYIASDNDSLFVSYTDSGVAIDTDWHWHTMIARSGRIEHLLDGQLINTHTTKVPTVAMTPFLRQRRRGNFVRYTDVNCWIVAPE